MAAVFAATLVTSLVVTWISTRSIDEFLSAKIDQKFPAILRSTSEKLELWYAQREVDLETFAGSETVTAGIRTLEDGTRGGREGRASLKQYLDYVLGNFPLYDGLFLLGPDGGVLLAVGQKPAFPEATLRRLASVRGSRVDDLGVADGRRFQVASAEVHSDGRRHVASLHASIRLDALQEVLHSDEMVGAGGVYLVGEGGEVLLSSVDATPLQRHVRKPPEDSALPVTDAYTRADGLRVVGSSTAFPRFGWTIVVEQPYDEAFAPSVAILRETLVINLAIVMAFGLVAMQVARSIARPVVALSGAALRIGRGETDVTLPAPRSNDEIGVLTRTFGDMTRRLQDNQRKLEEQRLEIENANARLLAQNQELQRMNEVFLQLSVTDELTRLHNHRFFQDHLPLEIRRAERTGEPLCLLLVDLDDFKQINDRHGHAAGDVVLQKVAEVMNQATRDMDLLARYGGEEFAVLAGQTPLTGAISLAEKIRGAISRARFPVAGEHGPEEISITASVGVAAYAGDAKAFFNAADEALYAAKAQGKDCVVAAGS